MAPARIAVIGSRGLGSNYGGIERMLDQLCPRLAAYGHEIDVFSRQDVTFENQPGLRVIRTPAIGGKHFETISRSALALALSLGRYDLIHFHALGSGILSSVTRTFGQRSIVTVHGLDQQRDKWNRASRFCLSVAERTLASHADQITVVSEPLRRYFQERYQVQATFIPNGAPRPELVPPGPLLASLGLEPGRYQLFASRLTPEKGCGDLIAAYNQLDTDQKLVIAGGSAAPDYLASLQAMADPAKIVFAGHRIGAELAELFSNANLFVLPSYLEGMSLALLEAIGFGLPAIVSDIPENRDVVGANGRFFPARNVAALRDVLAELLSNPAELAAIGTRLKGTALPDWDSVAKRYDDVYRSALRPAPQVGVLSESSGLR